MPIINTRTSLGFCIACNICNFEHYGILEYFADWVIFQCPSSPPCKSFPASSPTAKYFPDSSSVDKRTKREQTQEKFVMSEMSNVRNLVTICHVVRFCAIITFPPPSRPGVKRQKNPQTWDPIHLVADGSISVNCPIIITLYGSPNGPTRVQLAFSAKSWKYDIAGGGEKLSPSQCLETSKMK